MSKRPRLWYKHQQPLHCALLPSAVWRLFIIINYTVMIPGGGNKATNNNGIIVHIFSSSTSTDVENVKRVAAWVMMLSREVRNKYG